MRARGAESDAMAELHIVGQIVGAADFVSLPSLFCKFVIEAGSNFRLLQGTTAGQTQCDMPPVRAPRTCPQRARIGPFTPIILTPIFPGVAGRRHGAACASHRRALRRQGH